MADGPTGITEAQVEVAGLFRFYSRALGWNKRRFGGSQVGTTHYLRVAQD